MKSIIAAAGVAAIVALPTAAWGQAPPDSDQVSESATDVLTTAGCPVAGHSPQQPGPVGEECAGAETLDDPAAVPDYLCSVGKSVADGFSANGGDAVAEQINTVRSTGGCQDPEPTTTTTEQEEGGGRDAGNKDKTGGGGPSGEPGDEVLGNNAGPDGSLPRTGADAVIAGAGMGLAGAAGVVRRLLARS